jgi:hypothetical protein
VLASVALAAPAALLEERQALPVPSLNELTKDGATCKANTLIYARGATESGNLVCLTLSLISLSTQI